MGTARRHAGGGGPSRRQAGRGRARPARQGADLGTGPHACRDHQYSGGRPDRAHRHLARGAPSLIRRARVQVERRGWGRGPARHQRLGADEHGDAAARAPGPAPAGFHPSPRAHGGRRFRSPAAPGTSRQPGRFRAVAADIDINDHVNNTVYLDWALRAVPEGARGKKPLRLEVAFLGEARLGDEVLCRSESSRRAGPGGRSGRRGRSGRQSAKACATRPAAAN